MSEKSAAEMYIEDLIRYRPKNKSKRFCIQVGSEASNELGATTRIQGVNIFFNPTYKPYQISVVEKLEEDNSLNAKMMTNEEWLEDYLFDTKGTVEIFRGYHCAWHCTIYDKRGNKTVSSSSDEDGFPSIEYAIGICRSKIKEIPTKKLLNALLSLEYEGE